MVWTQWTTWTVAVVDREPLIPKHGGYRKLKSFQLAAQSKAFEKEGGFTERLYRVRTARRKS